MKRYQGREWYLIAGVHIRRISVQGEVLLVDWKHEEAINTIQHLTFDILPCFEELIRKKDRKKKTPELLSQVPSFPTLLKGWVSEICWICKITSLSTAQVTVYPCLSFPFSTYEHQFVFRRSNMSGRMYLLDHCDSLPWLLSAFQIPRRHHGQAQAANVRPCCVQHCSIDLCFNF